MSNAKPDLAANILSDEFKTIWVNRVESRKLVIGIIGLGYVGLPLAEAFIANGFSIRGFDIDETKLKSIQAGKSYIRHISDSRIAELNKSGLLDVTSDFSRIGEVDAILLCVPTPLDKYREPDLSYVTKTCATVGKYMRSGQLVILESTTWPGTSEEVMKPVLEAASGLTAHVDFGIAYSPEREDPGNPKFDTRSIPKVVGANTPQELHIADVMYAAMTTTVPVSDLKTAEAVKLVENIYRLVNIGLVNELKTVFDSMDIDIWEVIKAAETKPFGFQAFYPGPGLGGHCIPIDPFYLTWRARGFGTSTRFIELAGEITRSMPARVISVLAQALSDKSQKALNGAKVLVVGLAYKKNIDDLRESPSLDLIRLLKERGADVSYFDPFIAVTGESRDHPEVANMASISFDDATLDGFDCALIATDHDDVDYAKLVKRVTLVVDTRNATKSLEATLKDRVVKA